MMRVTLFSPFVISTARPGRNSQLVRRLKFAGLGDRFCGAHRRPATKAAHAIMKGDFMTSTNEQATLWIRIIGVAAILFGTLTIKEGGAVLFWSEPARSAAGEYVPFVLWFNFLAGFAYVVAGAGFWAGGRWAAALALAIAGATAAVFIAFGVHIAAGGEYESRTIVAMSLRTGVWIVFSWLAHRFLIRPRKEINR